MSHDATNWAIKQRGIRPALKVVLWNLCDRYHPDNGCFPRQDTLAADCELPRSTLNVYLKELEEAGLIAREQRRDSGSNRQESTRYRFPFEPDFPALAAQNPCPESGHGAESRNEGEPSPEIGKSRVQNLDTNPVREPVREPVTREGACAGQDGSEDDLKQLHARFRALEIGRHGNPWPKLLKTNADWAFRQFLKLTPEERAMAEERRDAFLAACPKVKAGEHKGMPDAPMLGVYLRDKRFEVLEAVAPGFGERGASAQRPDNWAVAYGPTHAAMLFSILLAGPERPEAAPRDGNWFSSHIRAAWPRLAAFWQQTDMKSGLPGSEADRLLASKMEFIPVADPRWLAWRTELKRRHLPDIRKPDGMNGAYFPRGGPEGLSSFEAMAREVRSDEHAA